MTPAAGPTRNTTLKTGSCKSSPPERTINYGYEQANGGHTRTSTDDSDINCAAKRRLTRLRSGCRSERPTKPETKEHKLTQLTILKRISVSGFDPEGEPEIRVMSDGTLFVVFNFMPPSFAENEEARFADFDKQLEKALGLPVHWEDREFFLIRSPSNDTAEKARAFLEGYRKNRESRLSAAPLKTPTDCFGSSTSREPTS